MSIKADFNRLKARDDKGLEVLPHYIRIVYPPIKRVLDIVVSAILLVVLLPVILFAYFAVRLTSKGPAIFWSERVGRNNKPFLMPKFRTMTTCSKVMSRETAKKDDIKLTSVGKILRKMSWDEIPQLYSVIRGDMSLIGPRPLLVSDKGTELRAHYDIISTVRPGITGLAQVNGRNYVSARDKCRYDSFYATRVCLWLDTKIALKTVGVVVSMKNVM